MIVSYKGSREVRCRSVQVQVWSHFWPLGENPASPSCPSILYTWQKFQEYLKGIEFLRFLSEFLTTFVDPWRTIVAKKRPRMIQFYHIWCFREDFSQPLRTLSEPSQNPLRTLSSKSVTETREVLVSLHSAQKHFSDLKGSNHQSESLILNLDIKNWVFLISKKLKGLWEISLCDLLPLPEQEVSLCTTH